MAADSDVRAISNLLEAPITPSARKIIERAIEFGWVHNFTSMVTRWAPHGEDKLGKPFFLAWHLDLRDEKWKWRSAGGMAVNGQRLNLRDAMVYLEHPEVIYPEPPKRIWSDKSQKTSSTPS